MTSCVMSNKCKNFGKKEQQQLQKESLTHTNIGSCKISLVQNILHCRRMAWNVGDLEPTDWGGEISDDMLKPVLTDVSVAPDSVLQIVSCGCKKGCGKRYMCRQSWIVLHNNVLVMHWPNMYKRISS